MAQEGRAVDLEIDPALVPPRRRFPLTPVLTVLTVLALAAIAVTGRHFTGSTKGPGNCDGLIPHDCAIALRVAHRQADRLAREAGEATKRNGWPASTRIVAAEVGPGVESRPNIGPPCTSGRIVTVHLIGSFPGIAVGGTRSGAGRVHGVDIEADAKSGRGCLLTARTGRVVAPTGASILYRRS
jgi:hypothetical protein